MEFFLLHLFTLLSVAFVRSPAMTPEGYWKSVLPNSPMPKSIKDLLSTEWNDEKSTSMGVGKGGFGVHSYKGSQPRLEFVEYRNVASENQLKGNPNAALFLLENDLHQGVEMNIHYTNIDQTMFLPRKIADSIPFSSNNLPQIYHKFSVKPDSMEAEDMKQTLKECEESSNEGEEKYCATSLESMVDFSTTKLGKHVNAISTEVNTKKSTLSQKYKINVVKKLAANKAVVCHKLNYAYAVFYCHKTVGAKVYTVSMIGEDGMKVNLVAVCHTDTAKWNPKHVSFQVLKVKPGTVPICHFLRENAVVWVPY